MMLTPEESLKLQAIVKDVQPISKLGTSGLGTTYHIRHPQHGECVLKLLEGRVAQNPKFLKKFLQSALAAREISQLNFARIWEVGDESKFWVIRELATGISLQHHVEQQQRLSPTQATQILLQLCAGLQPGRRLDLAHKNLKPANVIWEHGQVKIVDFSLPPTSPYYLSPEQCEGKKSDTRSDIYALGAIYHFCLSGRPPYAEGSPKDVMECHLNDKLVDIRKFCPTASEELAKLIEKMLAKKPDDRPQEYQELTPLLEKILADAKQSEITQELTPLLEKIFADAKPNKITASPASNVTAPAGNVPEAPQVPPLKLATVRATPGLHERTTVQVPIQKRNVGIHEEKTIDFSELQEEAEPEPPIQVKTIELSPELNDPTSQPRYNTSRLLKFKQVASEMVSRLRTINQTLELLDNVRESQDEATMFLDEMLRFITLKTGEYLRADRTMVFLLDEDRGELWSIMEQDEAGAPFEMRMLLNEGIAGAVVASQQEINIPYDCYDDPRSASRREVDQKTGYRTYTMMALPLFNKQKKLVAVIQLLNKLKLKASLDAPLTDRIDDKGFTDADKKLFQEFAPSMRLILESSQSFYKAIQRQRAAAALMAATQSLSQSSLDLQETLSRVMDEAKRLMNADRITLWLLDNEKKMLWTKIPMADGTVKEIRMPRNAGFVGQVDESGEAILIPFDLYDHPDSGKAKEMDQITGYRTCSMLCMPLFNNDKELIGVTQLINKRRQGMFSVYYPSDWPKAPDCWKASFNQSDCEFMKAFNIQAGVALQNARLFATIKQQEQMQRDILRSLTNGVISTDKAGNVIIANDSAKKLLGISEDRQINACKVQELIHLQEGDFTSLLESVLKAKDEKTRRPYYPEQTLLVQNAAEHHSINLSMNAIADIADPTKISGALVVIDDISDEKRVKNMMYRYMTQEVAEQLLSEGNISLGGQLKEVSVLFSDIRSYTTLVEGMNAEAVVALLNEYFEEMVDAIFRYKGTLDKYIGDAIMAVFGAPLPLQDHAWYAMQTGLEMRRRLKKFNEKRKAAGKKPIKAGIGIHSDFVISGNIGCSKRMELTAIGDGVNLASRLEGTTKYYGCELIVSEKTYRPYADRLQVRELDFITVKGKSEPVRIYELLGLSNESLAPQTAQMVELYQQARQSYHTQQFETAIAQFNKVLAVDDHNLASQLHIERCRHFLKEPPEADWNGVWNLTEK